jgi:chromosome segregation ATPase
MLPFQFLLMFFPLWFRFSIVSDDGPGAGAPEQGESDENPGTPAAENNEEPPRAPTVGERVQAILRTRGGLQAQANDLNAQLAQAQATNETLQANLQAAVQRAETAEARVQEYESELARLEAEASTVSAGVADEIAQMGIPERELPEESSQGAGQEATLEQLYAKLEKTSDPREAGLIAAQINKLEAAE